MSVRWVENFDLWEGGVRYGVGVVEVLGILYVEYRINYVQTLSRSSQSKEEWIQGVTGTCSTACSTIM